MNPIQINKIKTLAGHQDCVYVLEKSNENHLVFSSGGDGVIAEWDLRSPDQGRMLAKVESSVYALCHYPERNVLVVGQNFDGLHLIDLEQRKAIASIQLGKAAIFSIKVVDDIIFAGMGNGEIHVMDIKTLKTLQVIKASEVSARCMAYSKKRGELAVGFSDNYIRVYSLKDLSLKHSFEAHKNSVFTVQYSPDERLLLSGSRDAHLKIWSAEKHYELQESIVAHMYAINHLVFSADGKHFVTCSMDKSIKVWDATTFQLLKVIDKARHAGHGTSVNRLLWTNHNNLLISASDDRSISIWDINFNFSKA